MKFVLYAIFSVCSLGLFAQNQTTSSAPTPFFAQGLFPEQDETIIRDLESEIRSLPFISVVRLDTYSNRFFILTKDIDQIDELTLRSWFSEIGSELKCIQIGVHGIDSINSFPFVNCQN